MGFSEIVLEIKDMIRHVLGESLPKCHIFAYLALCLFMLQLTKRNLSVTWTMSVGFSCKLWLSST